MKFDLVSDLHARDIRFLEQWQPTSPMCVVAGDVSDDLDQVQNVLGRLGELYQSVMYVDGNDEHRYQLADLGSSYHRVNQAVNGIENVVPLYENIAVVNDVAFIGANAWWAFNVQGGEPDDLACESVCRHYAAPPEACDQIIVTALQDTRYLANSVRRLQLYPDIRHIVIVTHTVPDFTIIAHDREITENYRVHTTTNPWMRTVLDEDTEKKIHTWCFGHYHRACDHQLAAGRYVSNPRGREHTPWFREDYQPLTIEI